MNIKDEIVCQEALALLRQEVALSPGFSQEDYALPRTKAEIACRRAFDYVRRAFLALHDWGFARVSAAYAPRRPEGAIRVVDVVDSDGATVRWRVDGEGITAEESAATLVYTGDTSAVVDWPPLARSAFVAFLAKELAIPVTGRQDDLKATDALSAERLNAARLADLREGEPEDGPAAEALALLRRGAFAAEGASDDGILSAARRFPTFLKSAVEEVAAAHDWGGATVAFDALPKLAQSAAIALAAFKMATRVGASDGAAKSLFDLYRTRLVEARVWALEREEPEGTIARDVAAVLRPMQSLPPAALPRSIASRVEELLPGARREVLSAHLWNFARAKVRTNAAPGPNGECLVSRPADCARVVRVVGPLGEKIDWFMRGPWIVSRAPAVEVVYQRCEENEECWPPSVQRALVYRIAADIAAQAGDGRFGEMYRRKLSDAALQDAREGNPGRTAWGRGRFAAAMRGEGVQ
ncbi:MAG: hypothetical protein IKQ17_00240 [Kiritimatiellae bacterium]|nr:hypothetical protein [Kiritimatiellia bacterium]